MGILHERDHDFGGLPLDLCYPNCRKLVLELQEIKNVCWSHNIHCHREKHRSNCMINHRCCTCSYQPAKVYNLNILSKFNFFVIYFQSPCPNTCPTKWPQGRPTRIICRPVEVKKLYPCGPLKFVILDLRMTWFSCTLLDIYRPPSHTRSLPTRNLSSPVVKKKKRQIGPQQPKLVLIYITWSKLQSGSFY